MRLVYFVREARVRMPKSLVPQAATILFLLLFVLIAGASLSLYANLHELDSQYEELAMFVGRTVFQALTAVRDWNMKHQGVYVRISPGETPNEYLADPLRDVTTTEGLTLTKINHAEMARRVSELLDRTNSIHVHLTSLTPLRPANQPDSWEREALAQFSAGLSEEKWAVQPGEGGREVFRYMAPLREETSCLSCHHERATTEHIRGGMSVSLDFGRFRQLIVDSNRRVWKFHIMGLFAALIPIVIMGWKLVGNLHALQASLLRVRQLEGLVPICANCKKIRTEGSDPDLEKSWVPMERYIEERTQAEFTHGLCPDCRDKLYPDLRPPRGG